MTLDSDELKTVASLARSHAEDCLRVLEVFSSQQAELEVDPRELRRARGYMTKILLEVASIALSLEENALECRSNPELYAAYRETAQAA